MLLSRRTDTIFHGNELGATEQILSLNGLGRLIVFLNYYLQLVSLSSIFILVHLYRGVYISNKYGVIWWTNRPTYPPLFVLLRMCDCHECFQTRGQSCV